MTTKKYIKTHSDDPFERVTGNKLYEVDGQLGCRITPNSRMLFAGKQYMARYVAASIYLQTPIGELKDVETTCGVKNCVLPAHILVNNKNLTLDKNGNIEKPELEMDTPDENGDIHGVRIEVWEVMGPINKQRARDGVYNPLIHGFNLEE